MTTQALGVSEAATSYAAALASGSITKPSASKSESASTSGAMASTNGISEPAMGPTASHPVAKNSHSKRTAGGASSAPEVSRQPTPSIGGLTNAKYDDESNSATMQDEKSNGWEGNSQTSDSKSSGADTARASDYAFAQPTVNVWKKRQEEIAAKTKSVSLGIPLSVSPTLVPVSKSPTPGEGNGKKSGNCDEEKPKDGDSLKDPKENRKVSDEVPAKRGTRRGYSNDNETPLSLPPPVTDTISWPTPDLAQGEFRKDKDEKDKPAPVAGRGSNKTWVPVTIDLPYVPPIQSKVGRGGRGGRGGRDGGRGGVTGAHGGGDRFERTGLGAPEGERGRQYPNNRGGYQGGKGPKRSSSNGATAQRREFKGGIPNGLGERRREGVDWNPEAISPGETSTATQTDRSRPARAAEDGMFASDVHHYADGQEKSANGQSYHSRPDRGSQWNYSGGRVDPDSPGTYTPRERGSERGRYRGRGNYQGQFSNGHHSTGYQGHQGSSNPGYPSQSANGHQYPQHSHPRGGSFRGRGHLAYNSHPYRFNPAMQPPPPPAFSPAYNTPGYEYALMPTSGPPLVDFAALVNQINYYFSVDNLCKDMYLRQHMDTDGYVRLSFIMGFQRVQLHTKDINVLRDVCLESPEIQLTFGVDDYYVRKKDGWENWVLKEEDRDESARRDQSDWHIDPRQRKFISSSGTPPGEMSGSAEPFFPGSSTMAPMFYPQPINTSYGYSAPVSTLSATVPEFSPSAHQGVDAALNASVPFRSIDECPDAEIDTLIVVVKRPVTGEGGPTSPEASPSRRIPNGVSDVATIGERLQNTGLGGGYNGHGTSQVNGTTNHRSHRSQPDIGWFSSPQTGYVADPSMTHRSYTEVRAQALKQRETGGAAKNNDLITLYKFWSHFLVKRFNESMYKEFKQHALQDADLSLRRGVEEIFKLYERSFKDRNTIGYGVIRDFVELVKLEAKHGEALGIEKLRAILENPSLKHDYKNIIESLLDNDLRNMMRQGVGKKNGRSPMAESYQASPMAASENAPFASG